MNQSLARAIVATVAYTDQFRYALSIDQLKARLIAFSPNTLPPQIREQTLLLTISQLEKKRLLLRQGVRIALPGKEGNFAWTKIRQQYSQQKWIEAYQVANTLSQLPWIWGVFVTGSLAMDNVTAHDDLDFFIVTQPHRLWLSRLWVFWLALRQKKRRSRRGKGSDQWCFNMWLESTHLSLPVSQRSLYTAYEVLQTRCLFSRHRTQQQFYDDNQWISQYLPNAEVSREIIPNSDLPIEKVFIGSEIWRRGISIGWDGLNEIVYGIQRWYMWPHQTLEKIGRGFAFFHPRPTKKLIMRNWKRSLMRTYES